MFKLITFIFTVFYGITAFSEKIPDLRNYKDANTSFNTSPVFTETFNRPLKNWSKPKVFKVVKNEGFNGTGALFYERNNAKAYPMMSYPIKLDSRMSYEGSFLLRTENINFRDTNQKAFKDQVSAMGIQYRDNGKWIGISPTFAKHKELPPGQWQTIKFPVQQPAGKNMTASLDIYLRQGITGKMWIDNITIKPVGMTSAIIYPVASSLRLNNSGRIKMKATVIGPPIPQKNLALLIDAAGRPKLLRSKDGFFEADFGEFKNGRISVKVKLLDTARKLILASDTFHYFKSTLPRPQGSATLDKYGRLLVDKKPFMPIAIMAGFLHPPTVADLTRLKKAGFNTLMYYHPFKYLRIGGQKATQRETILASLDELASKEMKLIFALFRQNYQNQPGSRSTFDHIKGLDNVTDYVIGTVKNHPAMLAYYLSDENPLKEYPTVKRLRERVSKADPWHPTVTLTCRRDYFLQCAHTGDIFSYDYYPINTDKDQSFSYEGLKEAGALGVPHWFTPQAFHWGSCRRHKKYNTYRYPTEEEMRSMNLAAAIFNSKGFMFYSYSCILEQEKKLDPDNGPKFWAAVSGVANLLKKLTPWIMSIEKAPPIKISQLHSGKAKVIARAFSANKKYCIMIVSNGPDKASAEIFIPQCPNLKSQFGHTKNLGNGKYLFTGKNIASDALLP